MITQQELHFTPVDGRIFEDTIDGYFPLSVSLSHMMERNGFTSAFISLSHVPMAAFAELPSDAPVPLNIGSGRAGLIDEVTLWLSQSGKLLEVSGYGHWRWLDGMGNGDALDPMTRLAEPAFVQGIGIVSDGADANSVAGSVDLAPAGGSELGDMPGQLGWSAAQIWGPVPGVPGIVPAPTARRPVFGCPVSLASTSDLAPGSYLLSRTEPVRSIDTP